MVSSESYDTLLDLIREFPDDEACRQHLEQIRWGQEDGTIKPVCPHCGHDEKAYRIEGGKRYKCASCRKKFSVLVGTIFQDSKVPLQKWFLAIWLATSHKKGLSSCQLAKDIGVTQKTAWFMLHRVREMLKEKAPELLEGEVEVDETFIGGKEGWKHKNKKTPNARGRSTKSKTPVFGMVERETGKTVFHVVPDTKARTLQDIITGSVKPGSVVHSDEWVGYRGLGAMYDHNVINHGEGEYVREYPDDGDFQ